MYRVSEHVRSTHGRDGAVVLDLRAGQVLRLNATASAIFEELERGATESQIVILISKTFRLPSAVAAEDVVEFLKTLEQHNLIFRDELQPDSEQHVLNLTNPGDVHREQC